MMVGENQQRQVPEKRGLSPIALSLKCDSHHTFKRVLPDTILLLQNNMFGIHA
jgi:hypothetical protein